MVTSQGEVSPPARGAAVEASDRSWSCVAQAGTAEAGGLLAALHSVHDELVPALSEAAKRPKSPAQPAAQVQSLAQSAC